MIVTKDLNQFYTIYRMTSEGVNGYNNATKQYFTALGSYRIYHSNTYVRSTMCDKIVTQCVTPNSASYTQNKYLNEEKKKWPNGR